MPSIPRDVAVRYAVICLIAGAGIGVSISAIALNSTPLAVGATALLFVALLVAEWPA